MVWDDGDPLFGMGQECPEHGDEKMRECRLCGADFCIGCFPGSTVCPNCSEDAADDDEFADDEDDELMKEIGELIGADELEEDLDELEGDELPVDEEFDDERDV